MTAHIEIRNPGPQAVQVQLTDTDGTVHVDYVNAGETRTVEAEAQDVSTGYAPKMEVDLQFTDDKPEKVTDA